MSRIGKKPIELGDKVKAIIEGSLVKIEGPKGKFSRHIDRCLKVSIEGKQLVVTRDNDSRRSRSIHGLTRTLVQNMVTGVDVGFKRELEFTGVGYRISVSGNALMLNVGYSHPIMFELPDGVTCKVDKNRIILEGSDKQVLGQAAAHVRELRSPEPYKGKGIKYLEERVRRKEGKKMVG